MPMIDMMVSALLVLLGTGGMMASRDAGCLPPAVLGIVMLVAMVLEQRGRWPQLMRRVAAGVAFLGMVGTASYLPAVVRLLRGQDLPHQMRIVVLALTGVLCAVYVTIAVRRWVVARRSAS